GRLERLTKQLLERLVVFARAVHGLLPQLERSDTYFLRPGSPAPPTPSMPRRSSGPASSETEAKHSAISARLNPASAFRTRSTAVLIASRVRLNWRDEVASCSPRPTPVCASVKSCA